MQNNKIWKCQTHFDNFISILMHAKTGDFENGFSKKNFAQKKFKKILKNRHFQNPLYVAL